MYDILYKRDQGIHVHTFHPRILWPTPYFNFPMKEGDISIYLPTYAKINKHHKYERPIYVRNEMTLIRHIHKRRSIFPSEGPQYVI